MHRKYNISISGPELRTALTFQIRAQHLVEVMVLLVREYQEELLIAEKIEIWEDA